MSEYVGVSECVCLGGCLPGSVGLYVVCVSMCKCAWAGGLVGGCVCVCVSVSVCLSGCL